MIAVYLGAELDSDRFGPQLRGRLARDGQEPRPPTPRTAVAFSTSIAGTRPEPACSRAFRAPWTGSGLRCRARRCSTGATPTTAGGWSCPVVREARARPRIRARADRDDGRREGRGARAVPRVDVRADRRH